MARERLFRQRLILVVQPADREDGRTYAKQQCFEILFVFAEKWRARPDSNDLCFRSQIVKFRLSRQNKAPRTGFWR